MKKTGRIVKYAGIINKVTKKYTKNNTQMAFINVEDLYGTCEIIIFDSCYSKVSPIIETDNIILIEGRLSIREDENVKIIANNIIELKTKEIKEDENIKEIETEKDKQDNKNIKKTLKLDITNISETVKSKLRGAIKFFAGDKNNIEVEVIDSGEIKPCGKIYLNNEIQAQFEEILGKDRVKLG